MSRPAIPRPLRRKVLVEAGHRCAIPTCRSTTLEVHHITPYEKTKKHEFNNLIALCPTCHSRYHKGEIDHQSMFQYKFNLSILNGRYSDFEKRILCDFSSKLKEIKLWLPGLHELHVFNLLKDGFIKKTETYGAFSESFDGKNFPNIELYNLTEEGREFITKWMSGDTLD